MVLYSACVCVRARVRSTRYVNLLPLNQAAVRKSGSQVAAAATTSSRWPSLSLAAPCCLITSDAQEEPTKHRLLGGARGLAGTPRVCRCVNKIEEPLIQVWEKPSALVFFGSAAVFVAVWLGETFTPRFLEDPKSREKLSAHPGGCVGGRYLLTGLRRASHCIHFRVADAANQSEG